MFRILFLIANSVVNSTDVPPNIAFASSMAKLPHLRSHSASPPVTHISQEDDWPMPSSLGTKSWQTTAVKYFSPSRDFETVYDVHRREINVELPIDCFEPDLKARGYRQLRALAP